MRLEESGGTVGTDLGRRGTEWEQGWNRVREAVGAEWGWQSMGSAWPPLLGCFVGVLGVHRNCVDSGVGGKGMMMAASQILNVL